MKSLLALADEWERQAELIESAINTTEGRWAKQRIPKIRRVIAAESLRACARDLRTHLETKQAIADEWSHQLAETYGLPDDMVRVEVPTANSTDTDDGRRRDMAPLIEWARRNTNRP